MFFKYEIGDIVLANNPINTDTAKILHITERKFRRFDEDILHHNYYHGFAFGIVKDEGSKLFVPLSCTDKKVWGPTYNAIWSPHNKESDLEVINSQRVDMEKIFPYARRLSIKDNQ